MGSGFTLPSKEAARRGKVHAHIANAQRLAADALRELECAETYFGPDGPDNHMMYTLEHLKSAALAIDDLHDACQRKEYLDRAFPIR